MTARASATSFGATELHGLDAVRAIEVEWADLFTRARGVTPCLHPAWLLPWCEVICTARVGRPMARAACSRARTFGAFTGWPLRGCRQPAC